MDSALRGLHCAELDMGGQDVSPYRTVTAQAVLVDIFQHYITPSTNFMVDDYPLTPQSFLEDIRPFQLQVLDENLKFKVHFSLDVCAEFHC
jgi:hypothetical protein